MNSAPPLNSTTPAKAVTFADVAMKLVQDGPIYAIIGLVGAMAIGGHATASEAVITGLAGLLARMWPNAVQVAGKVGAQLLIVFAAAGAFASVHACAPIKPGADPTCAPVAYGAELVACSAAASTLAESVACENVVRARCHRPPRLLTLADAGADR